VRAADCRCRFHPSHARACACRAGSRRQMDAVHLHRLVSVRGSATTVISGCILTIVLTPYPRHQVVFGN
jgi:hypothetical protein